MKEPVHRDSLYTILGLSVLVVIFLFAIYLPGRSSRAEIERDIEQAEQTIKSIPQRVGELQALKDDITRRTEYLERTARLMPETAEVHGVLRQVAELAERARLSVTRLEPGEPEVHESYRAVPFRLDFSGPFRGVVSFLKGLEERNRLFQVASLTLHREPDRSDRRGTGNENEIAANMRFFVYTESTGEANRAGSAENDASSTRSGADTETR